MAVLDIVVRLKEMPTWQQGAQVGAAAIGGGGPAATAMVAVARLGVPAGLVSTCGNDRLAEIKMQTLCEEGVDVSRVVRRPFGENQICLVSVHEETGERVFSRLRAFLDYQLSPDELDRDYLTAAQVLHLDGRHAEAALEAARWMRDAGKTVVLDGSATRGPVPASMQALVRASDILICGQGFGPALTGRTDLWQAGEAILDMGPHIVVQTEGKGGAYTVTRQERFHTPSFAVDVIDTTGAGDVFHGAYIVAHLHGWDPRGCAWFASAVSAIKCTQLGGRAGIPGFQDVIAFLSQRGIDLC